MIHGKVNRSICKEKILKTAKNSIWRGKYKREDGSRSTKGIILEYSNIVLRGLVILSYSLF